MATIISLCELNQVFNTFVSCVLWKLGNLIWKLLSGVDFDHYGILLLNISRWKGHVGEKMLNLKQFKQMLLSLVRHINISLCMHYPKAFEWHIWCACLYMWTLAHQLIREWLSFILMFSVCWRACFSFD